MELSCDAYSLAPEEMLVPLELSRSPEKKKADDAEWKAIEKFRKAENWARKLKRGGKRIKRFVEWLARRKEKHNAHVQDHLYWIPFKWMTQRDCPMCRFGEREWRHWQAIAVQFDLVLWEEFWNWIEDLDRQATLARESAELEAQYGPTVPIDWHPHRMVDRAPRSMEGVEL